MAYLKFEFEFLVTILSQTEGEDGPVYTVIVIGNFNSSFK